MAAQSYQFGEYSVDLARREIHRGGQRLDLPAKVFDCVGYLIAHRDRAVGRDELISAVWGRADISDNLLAQIVLRARRAFDDAGDAQRYIRTITGFGYRWVVEADAARETPAEPRVAVVPSSPVVAAPQELATPRADEPATITTPLASAPAHRWKRALAAGTAAALCAAIAVYAALMHHPKAAAAKDLAFVLPAIVHDAPDFAWARLGLMDLVGQRLRESGQATVPSDTIVALAKFAGETPSAAELSDITAATGARVFLSVDVSRDHGQWCVIVQRLSDTEADSRYQGESNDLIAATDAAVAPLVASLDLPASMIEPVSGPAATLAQEVASDLLLDHPEHARQLIENAPAELRADARMRLESARVDIAQSRLPAARETLTRLLNEKSADDAPEFAARVLLAMASLELRGGDYVATQRYAEQLVRSSPELDTPFGRNVLGSGFFMLATAKGAQGAYDSAIDDFARARMVLATTGNLRTLALVDSNLAMMQTLRDRFTDALPPLRKSADYFRHLGASANELNTAVQIAATELALQDFAAAGSEDARLAELIAVVEDPDVVNSAREMRAEIAFGAGRMNDAENLLVALLASTDLTDIQRGAALALQTRLASERGDLGKARSSAGAAIALKWADEQPREYATTWLDLARAERVDSLVKSDDTAARAKAWAASSIYPVAGVLVHLLDAEQLAAHGKDAPARAAFEQALREVSERDVPTDVVEVTTSYAAWLMRNNDLDRALAVVGRNDPWAETNFRVAVAEARLYRAYRNEKLWRTALGRAQRTAGERTVPPDIMDFDRKNSAAAASNGRAVVAR